MSTQKDGVCHMNDDEIRKLVRKGFSDGSLPRQSPVIAPLTIPGRATQHLIEGGNRPDPCVICGDQPTQIWYPSASIAFHDRCHAIWQEEMAKQLRPSN